MAVTIIWRIVEPVEKSVGSPKAASEKSGEHGEAGSMERRGAEIATTPPLNQKRILTQAHAEKFQTPSVLQIAVTCADAGYRVLVTSCEGGNGAADYYTN